ncbi:uncharacterized protein ABDE67_006246 isoform 2-T3 [Symphorus nematophorus]
MEGRYINIVIPGRQEYLTLCEVEVTGQPCGNTGPTGLCSDAYIAEGGKATQSSLYGQAVPERAIDGNRDSNWHQGSCSTTQKDNNPWWRLDLLKTYKINTVTITNRGDCCQERIKGAEIRIGNSLNDNGNANPRCAVISPPAHGTSKTYVCNGMEGRYINIVIPGRREYLTLCEVEVTGQPCGNTGPTGLCSDAYIAEGGKATQSSLYGQAVPERAIDGNRDSNWHQGSCSTTQKDNNPWWRLDLLKTYKINTVTITNRGDCCRERIKGAEIRIGNSLNDNGNANPRCAVISPPAHRTSKTYVCNGMEGRYINIVIPGRQEYLTLCEVEVTGQPCENTGPTGLCSDAYIAEGGKATQSSLYGQAVPERAIDGNRDSNWHQGSCSTTQKDNNPWWRLDLLKTYKINTVTITNRGDCCRERIKGAEIRIGNSLNDNGNANPRCAVISPPAHGTSKTYVCNGMEGRYINIVIPGRQEYLTLCEVEVTGQPCGNTGPTGLCSDAYIAEGGKATQSSLYGQAVPERAIDGNRDSNWHQGSCSTTQKDNNPWWRLDLLKTYKINTVTITNRGDCCRERIKGAEIRIGNSLNDNGNANPRCAVISPPAHGTSKTYVCNGMEGRYINIVIPGRREYLTLCEVEVTGQPSGNAGGGDDSTEYVYN